MLGRIGTDKVRTKKSKQGVVLVTVLFILAIAMIFIASALMLTTETRLRLYDKAEDNQARLTVTSVAESFYQALYMQEITDDEFKLLSGAEYRIENSGFPGMGTSTDNQTTMKVEKRTDYSWVVTFKTTIGDSTECVQMVLTETPKNPTTHSFNHLVNVSRGGNMNRIAAGMTVASASNSNPGGGVPYPGSGNTLVFRDFEGNINSNQGNNYYYSTVYVTGGFFNTDTHFYRDVILWGDSAYVDLGVANQPFAMHNGADVYLIENRDSLRYTNGMVSNWVFKPESGSDSSVVFYNTGASQNLKINENTYSSGINYQVEGSNVTLHRGDGSITANYTWNPSEHVRTADVSPYTGFDVYSGMYDEDAGVDPYTWTAVAASNSGFLKTESAIRGAHLDSPNLSNTDPENVLAAGSYQLSGTMGRNNQNSFMPVVTCNLQNGDYYFYITDDFTIASGYFNVINGANSGHNVYFIVLPGKTFNISLNGSQTLCGIICTNCYSGSPANNGVDTVRNYYTSYSNIDGSSVPHAYIYGMGGATEANGAGSSMGTGTINMDANGGIVAINAYIALYRTGFAPSYKDDGSIVMRTGVLIYGRVSASGIFVEGSNSICIPYCPKPDEEGLSDQPMPQYSAFSISDFQYYTEA